MAHRFIKCPFCNPNDSHRLTAETFRRRHLTEQHAGPSLVCPYLDCRQSMSRRAPFETFAKLKEHMVAHVFYHVRIVCAYMGYHESNWESDSRFWLGVYSSNQKQWYTTAAVLNLAEHPPRPPPESIMALFCSHHSDWETRFSNIHELITEKLKPPPLPAVLLLPSPPIKVVSYETYVQNPREEADEEEEEEDSHSDSSSAGSSTPLGEEGSLGLYLKPNGILKTKIKRLEMPRLPRYLQAQH